MADAVPIYTKEALISRLEAIAEMGWVPNIRHGNHGGIGNTLEQLLGIEENNLPIPNAAEWELKAQRSDSGSLTTLFHMEPSPRDALRAADPAAEIRLGAPASGGAIRRR